MTEAAARTGGDRAGACFGDVIEVIEVDGVKVTRRYSCLRRDQYELTAPGPFPGALRERLAGRGAVTGGAALWVLDVPGAYQLTVAPRAGRALLVPRLSTDPPEQRSAAIDMAALIGAALGRAGAERGLP